MPTNIRSHFLQSASFSFALTSISCACLVMVSALSGAVLRMKLDKARKAQSVEKDKLTKANALVRVLTERFRSDEKNRSEQALSLIHI